MEDRSEARVAAVKLLARREHSAFEIRQKLAAKGFSADATEQAIGMLLEEGLLDDLRFAESYIRSRSMRGYGPMRIRGELRERGVAENADVSELLNEIDWLELAEAARRKRFGGRPPVDWKEQARQMRFLQYRGFSPEDIRSLMGADNEG